MDAAATTPSGLRDRSEAGFSTPRRRLMAAARAWTGTSLLGQVIFSVYIAVLYGGAALTGDEKRWNLIMPRGHVAGDTVGNTAIAIHLLVAVLILLGGGLQLLPSVRRRVPALHRWVGRTYFMSLFLTSPVGLYLVWVRGGAGDLSQHIAISLNALIMCACAAMAWRAARAQDFVAHRAWALRAWLAASGVYFFRLALFLWLLVFRAPVGFDPESFSGPLLTILAFAVYVVVPISALQLYFAAQVSRRAGVIRAATIGLSVLTVLTVAGIISVSMIIWVPAISR